MTWKKRKYYGKNENYSISKKLREENKIDESFELALNKLFLNLIWLLK